MCDHWLNCVFKKNLNIIFSNTNGAYIRQQFQTTSLNLKCGPCNWLRCCSSQHLAALLPLPSFLPDRGTKCEESVACQAIFSNYYKSTWHQTSIYHNLTSGPGVEDGYIQQYRCFMQFNSYTLKRKTWKQTIVKQHRGFSTLTPSLWAAAKHVATLWLLRTRWVLRCIPPGSVVLASCPWRNLKNGSASKWKKPLIPGFSR